MAFDVDGVLAEELLGQLNRFFALGLGRLFASRFMGGVSGNTVCAARRLVAGDCAGLCRGRPAGSALLGFARELDVVASGRAFGSRDRGSAGSQAQRRQHRAAVGISDCGNRAHFLRLP